MNFYAFWEGDASAEEEQKGGRKERPETNIQKSGTRFSYISFWTRNPAQKLIYENRVPDSRILVSGQYGGDPREEEQKRGRKERPETNLQ